MTIKTTAAALIAGFLAVAVPTFAHHGTNISYDHDKPTTLKGTVTEFVFSNPHAALFFDVKDEKGAIVHWAGELNSPTNLRRDGWNKETFKSGDQISITVFPSKAGTTVGVVDRSKPISVNGKELPGRSTSVD